MTTRSTSRHIVEPVVELVVGCGALHVADSVESDLGVRVDERFNCQSAPDTLTDLTSPTQDCSADDHVVLHLPTVLIVSRTLHH